MSGGLTLQEHAVLDHLVAAWNAYAALPHDPATDDLRDFRAAIHDAQRIVGMRALARLFPDLWRSSEPKEPQ